MLTTKKFAVNDTAFTNEDGTLNIAVLANDLPLGTPKTLYSLNQDPTSAIVQTTALSVKGAKISINSGKVNYDPTNDPTIQALAQGETAIDTFIYTMKELGVLYTATVTVNLVGVNDPAAITVPLTNAGQTTTDIVPINPFGSTKITDVDNGAQDSLVIKTLGSSGQTYANGILSGSGLTDNKDGSYTLAATSPTTLTTELDNLVFTPTAHQTAAGTTVTTNFSLAANDGFAITNNNSTNLVVTETATPPPPPRDIIGYQTTLITIPNNPPSFELSFATGINNSGEIVGNYFLTDPTNPANSFATGFTDINGIVNAVTMPGALDTIVSAINANGDLAGDFSTTLQTQFSYVEHNGVFTPIPTGGLTSDAVDINDNGQVLVNVFPAGAPAALIYDENSGNVTPITDDPLGIEAHAINNSGEVVGVLRNGIGGGPVMAFIYENGTVTPFGIKDALFTSINAINDKGDFAGDFEDTSLKNHGFLDVGNNITIFDMASVDGLNNNDIVVGASSVDGPQLLVYGGAATNNQVIDVSPNAATSGKITAINDSNITTGLVGFGSSSSSSVDGSMAFYGTPITV